MNLDDKMDDSLDRILSSDHDVIPSSTFVRNVMAAVHREASTPAPITFPWRRVAPGWATCAATLLIVLVLAIIQFQQGSVVGPVPYWVVNGVQYANHVHLGWIVVAVAASIIPTRLVFATK